MVSSFGVSILLTGLPGAGKTTMALGLEAELLRHGHSVTVLDGDELRRQLSSDLGFSRDDRDLHVLRVAGLAREIIRNGGVALCALIAPYGAARESAREAIEQVGGFVEVHVSTPLEVCEARDPKGLYAAARTGHMRGFTGIDDPYEVPEAPDLRIDTSDLSVEQAVAVVMKFLMARGFVGYC